MDSVGEKFSAAFDRRLSPLHTLKSLTDHLSGIGCAGEIKISPHEDYEKWAIDILVKFRDSERLQLLTGERQSGGVSGRSSCSHLNLLIPNTRNVR